MVITTTAIMVRVLWILFEYPYLRRHQIRHSELDRGSAKLWDVANVLEPIGFIVGFIGVGSMDAAHYFIKPVGLTLLIIGIGIRFSAIRSLGKYFTSNVVIKNDHHLVRHGPYKYVRHPSYTGALIAHLGLGLGFANWFSLAFSTIPFLVAAFYRMHVEDQALRHAFGDEYFNYASSTKRLIPKLY